MLHVAHKSLSNDTTDPKTTAVSENKISNTTGNMSRLTHCTPHLALMDVSLAAPEEIPDNKFVALGKKVDLWSQIYTQTLKNSKDIQSMATLLWNMHAQSQGSHGQCQMFALSLARSPTSACHEHASQMPGSWQPASALVPLQSNVPKN